MAEVSLVDLCGREGRGRVRWRWKLGDVAGTAAGKLAGYGPGRCDMGAFRRRFAHVGWKFQSVELVLEITSGRSIDSMYCVDARYCTVLMRGCVLCSVASVLL